MEHTFKCLILKRSFLVSLNRRRRKTMNMKMMNKQKRSKSKWKWCYGKLRWQQLISWASSEPLSSLSKLNDVLFPPNTHGFVNFFAGIFPFCLISTLLNPSVLYMIFRFICICLRFLHLVKHNLVAMVMNFTFAWFHFLWNFFIDLFIREGLYGLRCGILLFLCRV